MFFAKQCKVKGIKTYIICFFETRVAYVLCAFKSQEQEGIHFSWKLYLYICLLVFNAFFFSRLLIHRKDLLWAPFCSCSPEKWTHSHSTSLELNNTSKPCAPALRLSGVAWLMSTCLNSPFQKKKKKEKKCGQIQIAYWGQHLSCAGRVFN